MSVLDDASLVLIPSGYKASTLYSQVPTSGAGDLSFTRSTTGTRVNESGVIETVAINVPRIDYTNGCGQLLMEPQRTNLALNSENFSYSDWVNQESGDSSNVTSAPDGNNTADKIIDNTSSSRHTVYQAFNGDYTTGYSYSVFAKKEEMEYVSLAILTTGLTSHYSAIFDLENGTITDSDSSGSSSMQSSMTSIGSDGWYLCRIFGVLQTSGSGVFYVQNSLSNRSNYAGGSMDSIYPSFAGSGSDGVYFWGAQLELGSYPTSYIPTSGTSVTRTADASSTSGLSSLINSVEGVFMVEMQALANDGGHRLISLSDGANNRVEIRYNPTSNQIYSSCRVANVDVAKLLFNVADVTSTHKVAFRYKANDFSLWIDGVERATDVAGITFAASTLTTLSYDDGTGTNNFYGKVSELVLADYLTDTQMADLTTL